MDDSSFSLLPLDAMKYYDKEKCYRALTGPILFTIYFIVENTLCGQMYVATQTLHLCYF